MQRSIFKGDDLLILAYQRVGSIVNACAGLEKAVSYLEWQLFAFTWIAEHPATEPAERQAALRVQRTCRDKYASLGRRLRAVDAAFAATPVAARIAQEARLKEMQREWADLRRQAKELGDRRNEVAHSTLAVRDAKVIREIGRPWQEQTEVDDAAEGELVRALSTLAIQVGQFSTELTPLLPFADEDRYYTFA